MKSTELPDGWIVQTSKSLPNRVYYFNTKTNKSYWELPVDGTKNAGPSKMPSKGRKRKVTDGGVSGGRAATPEIEIPKKIKGEDRRVLKAKRNVRATAAEGNEAPPRKSKDTPQMQLLREKMAERQLKGNAPKKFKVIGVPVAKEAAGKLPEAKADEVPEKAAAADPKEASSSGAVKAGLSSSLAAEAQTLTPQMRVLLEKIKDRQSKCGTSRVSSRRTLASAIDSAPPLRQTRTRSVGSAETLANSSQPVRRSSRSSNASVEGNAQRASARKAADAAQVTRSGRSFRKNLAQERLMKLRDSLNNEQTEIARESGGAVARRGEDSPTIKITSEMPSIYADGARVTLLRERLRNDDGARSCEATPRPDDDANRLEDTFCEEMEWEPIEDEKIMQEIQVVRMHIGAMATSPNTTELPCNSLDLPDGRSRQTPKPSLYIVVDTNVFLSNLVAVEEARDAVFRNYGRPLIVIPWTVIRELDFIKDDKSMSRPEGLRAKARQAVRFLHQHFSARHPRILGQTPFDVSNNRQRFERECPDDEILQTCLQIRTSEHNVVLLSYDKNLCNKAMIHDLVTLGRHDPLEKVDYLHASDVKNDSFLTLHLRGDDTDPAIVPLYVRELRKAEEYLVAAKEIVASFMTVIVTKELQNLYNENWERYAFIKPPWSVHGVLRCAIKHWIAAVSDSFAFVRRAEDALKELSKAINDVPDSGRKLNDVGHILEMIMDLLQCVKAEKYKNLVAQSTRAITDLMTKCAETCRQFYEENLRDNWETKDDRRRKEEEEEASAHRAFQHFEEVYAFARDMCGLASSTIGMACGFPYKKLSPEPSPDDLKEMQPEVAANLNRLLQVLGTALVEINGLHVEHRAVEALYHALATFLPDRKGYLRGDFNPLDVYWCLKRKESVLRLGLTQLQELSNHFCRMASFRCT